jgi:hypothetical protein
VGTCGVQASSALALALETARLLVKTALTNGAAASSQRGTVRGLAAPGIRAARRAPRGELVQIPGGHYAPFLDGHEQAVEAELAFLRRHVLGSPVAR